MYNTSEEDRKFSSSVANDREQLEDNISKSIEKIEKTLWHFEEPNSWSEALKLKKNKHFWNTARYINIIALDLKILLKHQAFSTGEWERRLFSRQISLLIYETIDDVLYFFGKSFLELVDDLSHDPNFEIELASIRSRLNKFKQLHYKKLQDHRNSAIAHRDRDTERQLETIYSIYLKAPDVGLSRIFFYGSIVSQYSI